MIMHKIITQITYCSKLLPPKAQYFPELADHEYMNKSKRNILTVILSCTSKNTGFTFTIEHLLHSQEPTTMF